MFFAHMGGGGKVGGKWQEFHQHSALLIHLLACVCIVDAPLPLTFPFSFPQRFSSSVPLVVGEMTSMQC